MSETLQIFDETGALRDAAWLEATFGAVEVKKRDNTGGYYAAALYDTGYDAPTSLTVTVLGPSGERLPGIKVAFCWPDAPEDAGAGWFGRCVTGITDGGGAVGFGMGPGAYYFPPDGGPHAVWLYGPGVSDCVAGLGMLGGTNHQHLDVRFDASGKTEVPPPEEPPVPILPPIPVPPEPPAPTELWAEVFAAVDDLRAALVRLRDAGA